MKYNVRITSDMQPVSVVLTFQEYVGLVKTFEKLEKATDTLLEIRNDNGNLMYSNRKE